MTKKEFYQTLAWAFCLSVSTCIGASVYMSTQTSERVSEHAKENIHRGAASKDDLLELKRESDRRFAVINSDNKAIMSVISQIQQDVAGLATSIEYLVQSKNGGNGLRSEAK